MLKPSFRFFIIPLGAICTLASLSGPERRAPRPARHRLDARPPAGVDCSNKNPSEVCVISNDSEAAANRPIFYRPSFLTTKYLQRPGRDAPLRVALRLAHFRHDIIAPIA
jgi:hypothetical protein